MIDIISFDVATKSLAVSIIRYNLNYSEDINKEFAEWKEDKNRILTEIKNTLSGEDERESAAEPNSPEEAPINKLLIRYIKLLENLIYIFKNRIQIKYVDVVDLIPGKKITDTNIIYRTDMLYKYLHEKLDKVIESKCGSGKIFLLEYQMGPNIKSNAISTQIIYHMMRYNSSIELIGPSLKNKVVIGGENSKYSKFLERYTTNYAANKNHAKHNLLKLLEYLDSAYVLKNIKKKNIDDIADSVIMSIAYVLKNLWN